MKMALDTTAVPSGGLRAKTGLRHKLHSFFVYVKHHPMLYLMLIPGLFFLFIYKLAPLYGILIAFKDYNIFLGSNPIDAIGLSDWVGLEHFRRLFASSQFTKGLANTLIINGLKILWLFPIPIICAILLNEIRRATYRKFAQTAIYMPYFFSWVVIFGIFYSLFGSYGIINTAITAMGGTRIGFFTDNSVYSNRTKRGLRPLFCGRSQIRTEEFLWTKGPISFGFAQTNSGGTRSMLWAIHSLIRPTWTACAARVSLSPTHTAKTPSAHPAAPVS